MPFLPNAFQKVTKLRQIIFNSRQNIFVLFKNQRSRALRNLSILQQVTLDIFGFTNNIVDIQKIPIVPACLSSWQLHLARSTELVDDHRLGQAFHQGVGQHSLQVVVRLPSLLDHQRSKVVKPLGIIFGVTTPMKI